MIYIQVIPLAELVTMDLDLNKIVAEKEHKAYLKGYQDAMEAIKEAVELKLTGTPKSAPESQMPLFKPINTIETPDIPVRTRNNPQYIVDFVKANSPKKASEISSTLRKFRPDVSDKSIRVALHRLFKRGILKKDKDGYYS